MRNNLPVTQVEYDFPEGETLVSTTDLDSHITYCNPSFIRVSGFEQEELIGQPHNLIRHPDMPPEAFRDMWATLRGGKPWTGMVKNRRKNGEHYWVQANVTPMLENGRPTGYMSVRTKPSRAQVSAAEALYATMRQEQGQGRLRHVLEGGRVLQRGLPTLWARLASINLSTRMALALAALAALSSALAVGTWQFGGLALAGGLVVQAALVAGLVFWLHHSVTVPLRAAADIANRLAAGELGRPRLANRHDEVGALQRALNQVNLNLQAMVSDVRREAQHIDGSANEIAAASADLSQRTEAQSSSLQETAAAVEQIAATVQRNAGSAEQANRQAGQAGSIAERGSQVVDQVARGMQDIEVASGKIASINSVIDGIAFQTNILALNAAVEAARAGEQGRGFAVVASEVRSLAQRSADAARQIKELVESTRSAVETGVTTARSAGGTLQEVVSAAREVGVLVEGISVASTEQSTGISQVNVAVAQLDTATQQNAAMVEQTTASAQQLRRQAQSLAAAVQIFKVA